MCHLFPSSVAANSKSIMGQILKQPKESLNDSDTKESDSSETQDRCQQHLQDMYNGDARNDSQSTVSKLYQLLHPCKGQLLSMSVQENQRAQHTGNERQAEKRNWL